MSEKSSCIEKEALIDYLYGESDADARRRVDAHLRSCARCADEVRSLTDIRRTIGAWEPPDADLGFRVVADAGRPARARARWRPAPALAAAAVLAVAAAALILRPEIDLPIGERVLRIGWSAGESGAPAASNGQPSAPDAARPSAVEAPAGPTLRGTPAGMRTGGGAMSIPGPGVGADPEPDPLTGDEALLQQLRELIRDDASARQELLDYVRQVSERR